MATKPVRRVAPEVLTDASPGNARNNSSVLKPKQPVGRKWWHGDVSMLGGIILLGVLIYAHTLHAPWYLDDTHSILENATVRRLFEAFGDLFVERGFAVLTLAINYRFGGTSVAGYHLVNIAIHLATSCLVFLLLKRVFRDRHLLALGGALLFVAHPLQTQAVTYIVQRMTSLAGLFFFLAIYLYVRARETETGPQKSGNVGHWCFYAGALLSGVFAVLTKQNTAILPLALLLFDRCFLGPERPRAPRQLLLCLAPFCLVPLGLGIKSVLLPMFSYGNLDTIVGLPDLVHLRHNTPLNYLVTEFAVIWIYLRLLFIPYGQMLDYDVPIVTTLWHWPSLLGLLGIILLLAAAIWLRKRQPVISAGIGWFFLALSVESTIIPLDPVFEHRLYIPMFGFALVVMGGCALLSRRGAVTAIALLICVLAVLSWQRTALWNDPVAFYEDNLRRAPRSERVRLDLGNLYLDRGRVAEAQRVFEEALAINPGYVLIHINLARVYSAQKDYRKAVAILQEGLRLNPAHFKLYNNLAVQYNMLGDYRAAADALQRAIRLEPENPTVYFNLGVAYENLGLLDEAIAQFRRSITLAPAAPMVHFNLGNALFGNGDVPGAQQAFLSAYRLNPNHAGTLYNLALVCFELGDLRAARSYAVQLQRIDPAMANRLTARIR